VRRFLQIALPIKLIAFALMGLVAVVASWREAAQPMVMDDWNIEDLLRHLDERNVQVRAVPVMENGPLSGGVFLTTTEQPWKQLNRLPLVPDRIHDWDGTVWCARIGPSPSGDDWLWQWGDCADHQGPFVLFGDPSLRARIKEALRDLPGEVGPQPPGTLAPQPVAVAVD
jgi:hypothetical protein